MRFEIAIEHLVDNYRYAKSKVWIRDKVAWALYQTWREADDRKTENSSEIPNNCEPQTEDERIKDVVRGFMGIVDSMRNPTEEEKGSVNKYLESISKPTGVNIFDMMDEPQTDCDHKCVQTEVGCEQTDCAWK